MKRWMVAALLLGACSRGPSTNDWIEALGSDRAVASFSQLDQSLDPAIFEALLAGTRHKRAKVRAHCARLLGRKKDVTAIAALRRLLDDPDATTRGQAARSLAVLADSPQMLEWLQDEQSPLPARAALAAALVDEQVDEVLPVLRGWLADPGAPLRLRQVCCCVLKAAGPRGQAAELALAEARRPDNDLELRAQALELYGSQAQAAGIPTLVTWLKNPSERLQEGALAGLGFAHTPAALPVLATALRDRDRSASARLAALRSISQLQGPPLGTELLLEALRDPDYRLRRLAASLLPCYASQPSVKAALLEARKVETEEVVEREIERALRHLGC